MENKLVFIMAQHLANRLNRYTGKEGLAYKKMALGMEVLIINVTKLIVIYLLAAVLWVVVQTAILHMAYIAIKRCSFGLHALNSTVCTVVSCCLFVITPWALQGVGINNIAVTAIFIPVIVCLLMYAPADTKARPLIGPAVRAKLKRKAVVSGIILMVAALLIPYNDVKLLLALGAAFQCVAILPLTYKILKRSERNYETYEIV